MARQGFVVTAAALFSALFCAAVYAQSEVPYAYDLIHKEEARMEHTTETAHEGAAAERLLAGQKYMLNGVDVQMANADAYFTPNVLSAVLVMLTGTVLFFVGCCCLANVKTPSTFADKTLNIHKEY